MTPDETLLALMLADALLTWDDLNDDGQDWGWGDVTHWMPLPAVLGRAAGVAA